MTHLCASATVVYMHVSPPAAESLAGLREVAEGCACLRARMAARAVTRRYDEFLRPAGLKATQFSLLVAAALGRTTSLTALSDALGLERTTLTRNLRPLARRGLIAVSPEGWRRARGLRLTAKGRAALRRALPRWRAAQDELRTRVGAADWPELLGRLNVLARSG